jgi:hypothetical protein
MDWQMFKKVQDHKGKICIIDEYRMMMALSISCDKWPNKHTFDRLAGELDVNYDLVINEFPEIITFYEELYGRM